MKIEAAEPRVSYYHYTNPSSQGALICQTKGFPLEFDGGKYDFHCQYSDRISQWDIDRYRAACEIAGVGDQGWSQRLPALTDDRLKEFAKIALDLDVNPRHVRIVHHYNVATGYSCPTVEAIARKAATA